MLYSWETNSPKCYSSGIQVFVVFYLLQYMRGSEFELFHKVGNSTDSQAAAQHSHTLLFELYLFFFDLIVLILFRPDWYLYHDVAKQVKIILVSLSLHQPRQTACSNSTRIFGALHDYYVSLSSTHDTLNI